MKAAAVPRCHVTCCVAGVGGKETGVQGGGNGMWGVGGALGAVLRGVGQSRERKKALTVCCAALQSNPAYCTGP